MSDHIPAIGTHAPAFNLPSAATGERLSLSELRGSNVALAFYPADWSPVCGDQLALYNELADEFAALNTKVIGISVDGSYCHDAFAQARGFRIPLLADFEPKGQTARHYGSYDEKRGVAERNLFVIDANGFVRWSHRSPPEVNPGADGILQALRLLSSVTAETEIPAAAFEDVWWAKGPASAVLELVEFGDYQCPHCREAHEYLPEVLEQFEGRIRYVFRNFPLTQIHKHAEVAAEAAEAAGSRGKFWEMHDAIFEHQLRIGRQDLLGYAGKLGLHAQDVARDLDSGRWRERVRRDFGDGVELGVNGTPCFFINGSRFDGSNEAASLSSAINAALADRM